MRDFSGLSLSLSLSPSLSVFLSLSFSLLYLFLSVTASNFPSISLFFMDTGRGVGVQ